MTLHINKQRTLQLYTSRSLSNGNYIMGFKFFFNFFHFLLAFLRHKSRANLLRKSAPKTVGNTLIFITTRPCLDKVYLHPLECSSFRCVTTSAFGYLLNLASIPNGFWAELSDSSIEICILSAKRIERANIDCPVWMKIRSNFLLTIKEKIIAHCSFSLYISYIRMSRH